MTITTIPNTDRWQVRALWYGEDRVVATGTLFACCAWVAKQIGV
jgi:hypothetical protein